MKYKKAGINGILIFLSILVLLIIFGFITYLFIKSLDKPVSNVEISATKSNPMEGIKNKIFGNSSISNSSSYNETKVIEEGIKEFDENYINYILYALGVSKLHSALGFGNPVVLVIVDNEEWSSEIIDGQPNSIKQGNENADINVIIGKEEAVKSLLAEDIAGFMKNSVNNGNTKIEMIAGNPELFAKGYLTMYNSLTGNSIKISW